MSKSVAIIGGGASGFFCAVNLAKLHPDYKVTIYEKSQKLLSKVRISGGGRCNVTHACFDNNALVKFYPRGEKQLKSVFSRFNPGDTINWFDERGVNLKVEADNRMFPESNNSETIIACFLSEAEKYQVDIKMGTELISVERKENSLYAAFRSGESEFEKTFDAVVIASGGFPKAASYSFLSGTGHKILDPIPSLFTLNLPDDPIIKLMGVSVPDATIKVASTSYQYKGPLLITHWGMSGPAVLKLSAFAAAHFFEKGYDTHIIINWCSGNEEDLREELNEFVQLHGKHQAFNPLFGIPKRLWEYFLFKSEIPVSKPWAEVSRKQLNKLIAVLTADNYHMKGKTTFKEEFVTCGGVDLKDIEFKTMESKVCKGLYFTGEVLNIDGITGGFNFQSAWSTAWIAANAI